MRPEVGSPLRISATTIPCSKQAAALSARPEPRKAISPTKASASETVFLFFGLFSRPDGSNTHHRIYGYLEVTDVTRPGTSPTPSDQPDGFRRRHPHTVGQWNANNTIYVGPGDIAATDDSGLRLSLPDGPVSYWAVPSWLRDTGLTYHGNPTRWETNGVLRTAARGQEFVADATGSPEAAQWLRRALALISCEPPETDTVADPKVVVVMLRQPRRQNDPRTDPLWEFGSFGCTGCHRRNLMNPHKMEELNGCRLAFAQGGDSEVRLVHVTPPARMVHHGSFVEATWRPQDMPLAFDTAPLLVDNQGGSDFPVLMEMIDEVSRNTPVARFASKFRSRRQPLPADVGRQLVEGYRGFRRRGATVAQHYAAALPYPPSRIDQDREATYHSLLMLANA